MQVPQPDHDALWHLIYVVAPVILTLLGGQMAMYRANKHRGEERDKKIAETLLMKDNRLAILLENYRLHEHVEREGPLTAENIRYPRDKRTSS